MAFADIAAFIADNPTWPKQSLLHQRAEEAMAPDLAPAAVLAWFGDREPVSTTGRVRRAQALLAVAAPEVGRAAIRNAWTSGNFTRAAEKRFYRTHRKLLSHDDHVRRVMSRIFCNLV